MWLITSKIGGANAQKIRGDKESIRHPTTFGAAKLQSAPSADNPRYMHEVHHHTFVHSIYAVFQKKFTPMTFMITM